MLSNIFLFICLLILFIFSFPQRKYKLCESKDFAYLVEEFLAHSKHSTNICLMNIWEDFSETQ